MANAPLKCFYLIIYRLKHLYLVCNYNQIGGKRVWRGASELRAGADRVGNQRVRQYPRIAPESQRRRVALDKASLSKACL